MDRRQIAEEVLAAVGGRENVTANDICMTRLRILTEDPSLVDTEQLSAARGVLGFVKRGENGIEVVFGPGKVEAVHEALVQLTGVEADEEIFDGVSGAGPSPLHVHITANPLRDAARAQNEAEDLDDLTPTEKEASVEDLVSMLDTMETEDAAGISPVEEGNSEEDEEEPVETSARVLVINGPNINMLGIREPDIYGHDSYQAMLRICHDAAQEAGFAGCTCFQSNHEGDLIDAIQDAYGTYAGIIINPGAYTHTSIAILDAAKAVGLPMIEVHISNVEEREEFRQVSYIRAACFETIMGLGVEGYRKAIFDMAEHLGL
ncbi:type II 3-dehydroquinate dehydratase [Thermophilibacter provencensis]|uniref:3-dehydroquinate dehydratase n=1 Tax=Thermophilibacter provencensis TaxID=1852386 RepID=A0ABT7V2T8_9ACTN|nr:type II 3-dehydroquinate dehydratase [Thermophilibacter provencensis]MDM8270904.1 type II 3-dehydroquinate dehydratase [Thermophilibacter provencensis]